MERGTWNVYSPNSCRIEKLDLSRIRSNGSGQHIHQSALPGAVFSNNGVNFSLDQGQVDPVERPRGPEVLAYPRHPEGWDAGGVITQGKMILTNRFWIPNARFDIPYWEMWEAPWVGDQQVASS